MHGIDHILRPATPIGISLDGNLPGVGVLRVAAQRIAAAHAAWGFYGDVRSCCEGGQRLPIGAGQFEQGDVFGYQLFACDTQRCECVAHKKCALGDRFGIDIDQKLE
jgi:hypothetical protein